MPKKRVILGLLGTTLDVGRGPARWERWRPTVSLAQHEDLAIDRMELLHPRIGISLATQVREDIAQVSPETSINLHLVDPKDPWDFEEVYTALHDFASTYPFDPENEEYLVHITTGTHVAQICLFLLTETRRLPAKLIQTSPKSKNSHPIGDYRIIDLDLSKYDSIAARHHREFTDNIAGLKSGISTRNAAFNTLIEELEHVAAHSVDPVLLQGPTGAGKSQLARRIFDLKRTRRQINGSFVEINCATLRGDTAMSTLFGHKKGAYTGATTDRPGLLKSADGGVLFLDEIGELGLDEQAMLLRALEEKRFLPLGSDTESTSSFQLIAGTNKDLRARTRVSESSGGGGGGGAATFRDDLLARINLWTFKLPALRDRPEDIEPNLDYELDQFAKRAGRTVRFSAEARAAYLAFATGVPVPSWSGNFRDLSASITRMATMSPAGRITEDQVRAEIIRLNANWQTTEDESSSDLCAGILGPTRAAELDRFDRIQLADVLEVCRRARTLSEAGRELFAISRTKKSSTNDADRLKKYLARFALDFDSIPR